VSEIKTDQGAPALTVGSTQGRWLLAAAVIGSGMTYLDGTVVTVALPIMHGDLGATFLSMQWVISAYALFLSALLLVGGALGDNWGLRRVYVIGIALFAIASLLCGVARDAEELIIARAIQGIGGALLVPGSLALLNAAFALGERSKAIATWSALAAVAPGLGPWLGGWITDTLSWRWIFFINIPLALIAIGILLGCVRETPHAKGLKRLDWGGATTVTPGLGGSVFGFIESGRLGFMHPAVIGSLFGGVALLLLFCLIERRVEQPMMPLSLFRSTTFVGANAVTLFLCFGLGGTFFFLPFLLIEVRGYSAMGAGAVLLPTILCIVVLSRWAGTIANRIRPRTMLVAGPSLAAIGFLMFGFTDARGNYWTDLFPAAMVVGLGLAATVAPLSTTVMAAASASRSGVASAINNAVSRTASLIAIPILGVIVLAASNAELDRQFGGLGLSSELREQLSGERLKLAAAEIPETVGPSLRKALGASIDAAFLVGYRRAMFVTAALAILGAIFGALLIEAPHRGRRNE